MTNSYFSNLNFKFHCKQLEVRTSINKISSTSLQTWNEMFVLSIISLEFFLLWNKSALRMNQKLVNQYWMESNIFLIYFSYILWEDSSFDSWLWYPIQFNKQKFYVKVIHFFHCNEVLFFSFFLLFT
jgi:hypothetical protein